MGKIGKFDLLRKELKSNMFKENIAAIIGYILVFLIIPWIAKNIVGYEVLSIPTGICSVTIASLIIMVLNYRRERK